jgi:hypothetical protein
MKKACKKSIRQGAKDEHQLGPAKFTKSFDGGY